ncbi:MAG: hypothetical protein QMD09_00550, partial [Desulfatibacillaceae bacterium]|nr:hypothetical protein [Desulfatibacillaceae bacterium]
MLNISGSFWGKKSAAFRQRVYLSARRFIREFMPQGPDGVKPMLCKEKICCVQFHVVWVKYFTVYVCCASFSCCTIKTMLQIKQRVQLWPGRKDFLSQAGRAPDSFGPAKAKRFLLFNSHLPT